MKSWKDQIETSPNYRYKKCTFNFNLLTNNIETKNVKNFNLLTNF